MEKSMEKCVCSMLHGVISMPYSTSRGSKNDAHRSVTYDTVPVFNSLQRMESIPELPDPTK